MRPVRQPQLRSLDLPGTLTEDTGFEPVVQLLATRLFSKQVHSTTLPIFQK